MKVLIVEDNADHRETIRMLLSAEGYSVIAACDGREALSLAEDDSRDLIITDISMPELDGIAMIAELRARPEFERILMIVLSACSQAQRAKVIEAEATVVKSKPKELAALMKSIKSVLIHKAAAEDRS